MWAFSHENFYFLTKNIHSYDHKRTVYHSYFFLIFQASKKLDEKSKSDVLELLGELEGELEAKDIAIATLKVSVIVLIF